MVAASATLGAVDLDDRGENIREDLSDVIYMISPTETPFQTNIGRGDATSDFHEWLRDELATAIDNNAHVEGDDFGTNVVGDTTDGAFRLGNFCQISKKQIKIGRRANIARKAGRRSEIGYQVAKKGKELRRDVESALLANVAGSAESGATAARSAGLRAWIRTNDNLGATGVSPTLSSTTFGFPNAAATDGTLRALEEFDVLAGLKDAYVAGGDVNMMMLHPTPKQLWSAYLMQGSTSRRSATQYQDQGRDVRGGVNVVGGVGSYTSDFGVIDIVPNRFQRTRDVYLLDTDLFQVAYFDGYKVERLAKVGDSERYHLIVDWCLESNDESGSAMIADVDATTAVIAGP